MKRIHDNIDRYYTDKIRAFGATPQGVDWKDESSQMIRLNQLMGIIRSPDHFTINDLGSGYGRLLFYLIEKGHANFSYQGYDVSDEMIKVARRHAEQQGVSLCAWSFAAVKSAADMRTAAYTVASGIFNVKMEHTDEEWTQYLLKTLDEMDRASSKGFSFNVLTKYSDKERMRPDLYYADPCFLFDYCKSRFSRNVALLHDYDLYEFTMLVRKE